jgi:hypothetical protein
MKLHLILLLLAGLAPLHAAERIAGAAITVKTPDAIRILPLKPGQPRLYDSDPLREIENVEAPLAGWQFTSIPQRTQNRYEVKVTKPGYLYVFGSNKEKDSAEKVFGTEVGKWERAEGAIAGKNSWVCVRRKMSTGESLSIEGFELQLAAQEISTPNARVAAGGPPETTDDAICGRWKMGNTIWIVSPNGQASRSKPGFSEKGTWKCTSTATPATYEFNWGGGRQVEDFHLSSDHDKILGKNNATAGTRAKAD